MKGFKKKLPPVGMRIIKSALGVFLGFIIYFLRGKQGAPFYTALSVLWCVRAYPHEAKSMAKQRTFGTLLGGFFGLIMIMFELHSGLHYGEFVRYTLISLLIIPLIYATVLFEKKNASYFACVVYLSITVLHITDQNPYIFVLNRVLDTLIGIGVALLLTIELIPRKRDLDTLFVSGIDNTLFKDTPVLSPYSKVELNRMIDVGANFTVATMRTPASIVETLRDIHFKLPVVAMDGAVLFDIKENRYLEKREIEKEDAVEILTIIKKNGYHVFTNVVIEDMWIIYYDELLNEAEEDILNTNRRSPYRNYMKAHPPEGRNVVYFMVVDTCKRIEALYEVLEQAGINKAFKVLKYESTNYPGYMYLKIYNKLATKETMLEELQERTGLTKVMRFGSIPGESDVVVTGENPNEVVRILKKRFETNIFSRK